MASRTRSNRRLRWLAAGLLIAVATVWMARDLPRRLVEAMVADLLQGQVRLDGFRVGAWRQLDLLGLEIKYPATLPMVERVAFDEVGIEGTIAELLAGRIERLTLRGMEARLITTVELEEGPGHEVLIGELRIEPATVTVTAEAGVTTALTLEGSLRDVGEVTAGTVSVRSPTLELVPLLELATLWAPQAEVAAAIDAGRLVGFAAELEIDGDRYQLTLDVANAGASNEGRQLDLGAMTLTATAAPAAGAGNLIHVEIDAELEMVDEVRLAADWDRELGQLVGLEGKVGGLDLGRFSGDVRIDGDADLVIRGEGPNLVLVATVRPRGLDVGAASMAAERALLTLSAKVPLENLTATPPKLEGAVQASLDLPSMTGTFGDWKLPAAAFPAKIGFDGSIADDADPALRGTWTLTSASAGRVSATGGLRLEEAETGPPSMTADLAWTWDGSELGALARLLEGLIDGDVAVGGRLSGRGRLRGSLSDPEVHAELKLEGGSVELTDASWKLADVAAQIELDWRRHPRPPDIRIIEAAATLRVPDWEPIPFTLQARVPVARDLGSGALSDAMVSAPGLGRIEVDGSWRRDGDQSEAEGTVRGQELDLARWQSTLRLDAADLAFKGFASTELKASLTSDSWKLRGPVELDGAGFSSTDGGRVLEGLAADWTVEVSGGGERPITARADGKSSGFLVLWDTFFADLSSLEAQWHVDASLETADLETVDDAWRLAAEILVPDGPTIEAGLRQPATSRGELDYTLDVRIEDLALTHDRYLRPILDQRFDRPVLGGKLTASLYGGVGPGDGASLTGELRLEGLSWEAGEELVLAGFDLELPLDLRFGSSGGGDRLRGRLSFDRLSFRGLELPPARTGLWTENDGLELEDPLSFQILGGSITLGRLKLEDLFEPGRYLESSLSLTGLSLGKIS
ncbi:MAG: hypothetical protein V3T72_05260, partial [Thermoanaerobaculia bacterium]